ncbi:MAG: DUF2336 domain-containing protein [Alphaproteobacteria bacterium]|nr:DUF2336 domain-containing protein [Alphaproteobacteria bacterium]
MKSSEHPKAHQPPEHPALPDVEELVDLARAKSRESRAALFAAIGEMFSDGPGVLTDRDRSIMADIIRHLLYQVEVPVRRTLAEHFARLDTAPTELVYLLANDKIEVAYPLLVRSEVLRDAELIEIVQQRTMEHQLAISIRPQVSLPVSDALVATGNVEVVTTLLNNDGAKISDKTLSALVEQSRQQKAYQAPLSRRRDLTPDLAKKLCTWVSTALRQHIMENFDIDPQQLNDAIENATKEVMDAQSDAIDSDAIKKKKPGQAAEDPGAALLEPLKQGDIARFMDTFADLSGLRLTMVRRLVFEPGGEGLAIACKAIGVNQAAFATIFLRSRAGRLGDKQVEQAEIHRAMSFYEGIDQEAAQVVLNRWETDPGFLTAMSRSR